MFKQTNGKNGSKSMPVQAINFFILFLLFYVKKPGK